MTTKRCSRIREVYYQLFKAGVSNSETQRTQYVFRERGAADTLPGDCQWGGYKL